MTSIRRPFLTPPRPESSDLPTKAKEAGKKIKPLDINDGFERTDCFPNMKEKLGGKHLPPMTDCFPIPGKPDIFNGGILEDALYRTKLRDMTPEQLFKEEAKQQEILEDASTGPIQDKAAAADAQKKLEALEAERARRAEESKPPFTPHIPHIPHFPRDPVKLPDFPGVIPTKVSAGED